MLHWGLPLSTWAYAAIAVAATLLLGASIATSRLVRRRSSRLILFLLRALIVAAIIVILADPVRPQALRKRPKRQRHIVLIDRSSSMGLGRPMSRLKEAEAIVRPVLNDRTVARSVQTFAFDNTIRRLPSRWARQKPTGNATLLAGAVTSVLEDWAWRGLSNIVVFTDGRIHDHAQLARAVRLARRARVPISTCCVGSGGRLVNLAIENCIVDRHASPGMRLPVRVLIRGTGTAGDRCMLTLDSAAQGRCAQIPFTAQDGLTQTELILNVGDRSDRYTLSLSALPGEITVADNAYEFRVALTEPKLRVIYMEGTNRHVHWGIWEWEFIERALKESGRIDVDVFTVTTQAARGGRLYHVMDRNRGYPRTREELFGYDVVICSDINRSIFTDDQRRWTRELVAERGGGFCMVGGVTSFGVGGYDQTVWEQMIPVDMHAVGMGYVFENFKPRIPSAVRGHPILQISPDPRQNDRILDAIPHFAGTNLVRRAKPGATVLAIHPGRDMPIICVQAYGKGRSMAFTPDSTCDWGMYFETQWGEGVRDNRYFKRFWVNTVTWLGENSLAHHAARIQGNTERISYHADDRVRVHVRLIDEAEVDPQALRVSADFDLPESRPRSLLYNEDRKEFAGILPLPSRLKTPEVAINFRALKGAEEYGRDRVAIRILEKRAEFLNPHPDPQLLSELARVTGGRTIQSTEDLKTVLTEKPPEEENQRSFAVPIWDNPWVWAALIALLTVEWLIRRMARLGAIR